MTTHKSPDASACCDSAMNVPPNRSALFTACTATVVAIGTALVGCATVPASVAKPPVVERIVPTANGYVVCSDCATFQPTVKRSEPHVPTADKKAAAPIPLAQSLAANEQVVVDRIPAHAATPKFIKVLFATNDAHISTSEARRLRVFLDSVPAGASLSITGYTDGTGKHAANLRLADRRANAVKDFVAAANAPRRISISHATNCCPDSPDATADERAMNRHVEVTVIQ